MDDRTRQKLLPKFRESTQDRVARISGLLLGLERGAGAEALEDLLRELHTLKGEARLMGFSGLSQVLHAAEDAVRGLPAGAARGGAVDALLRACDEVPRFLDGPPDGGAEASRIAGQLRDALGPGAPAAAGGGGAGARSAGAGPAARGEVSVRVEVERLDEIAALAGDLLVDGARAQARSRELQELFARWSRLAERALAGSAAGERSRGRDRSAERLERDVHILRSDTFRLIRRHADAVSAVQGQFAQLADQVGQARLVPLAAILEAFPRAARDLAREQGKEATCELRGSDAAVDRAVLLALGDPLVHLLRNAVDHGIEPPEERERAGKPRAGRIEIAARSEGDQLVVSVEDDGRGIDPVQVVQAAVRRGLVGEVQATGLAGRAALELLFLPGFTTRDEVGELSGRGIGLDVVRRRVSEVGGSALVEAEPGKGARFTLRVPQSLALLKVLLVRVDEDVYAIPAADVESVGRIDPAELTQVAGIRTVRHRERLVPVVALGPLLSLNGGPRARRPAAAFLSHGQDAAALVVDGLSGEREVAVKAPGPFLRGMRFVAGAAPLPDGRAALLLSTPDLLAAARRPGAVAAPVRERRRLRILLVDDSAVAREAEAALLRGLGHEVEEALDGEDGWARLEAGGHDLLLTDVQMPGLDGIDLTRRVKGDARHARLPVVILSSLSAPEERRRGVDAGADAYLVKGEMDADSIAAALERLCGVRR
jgi:two-component system chemotaxis sensor kinase CheA/two-component system sensor histidine kinase and response regulator WspE